MSDGDTVEEAVKMGEDAKRAWIKTRFEQDLEVPEPFSSYKYRGEYFGCKIWTGRKS